MDKKALVKIDVVGSKNWCSQGHDSQDRRKMLLNQLKEVIYSVYEKADLPFPEGEFASAQGDCINLIIDDPEYAVLKTIEFQREWFEYVGDFPDCRAIIDFSNILVFDKTPRTELLSEGFENISVIEKDVTKGEIFITENVLDELDSGIVKTTKMPSIEIANSREIDLFKLNYEDPRILEDNYLVQTIFIADSKSDLIRDKVIGSIIIGIVSQIENKEISLEKLYPELEKKGVRISEEKILQIISENTIFLYEDGKISLDSKYEIELEKMKSQFEADKEDALNFLAMNMSMAIGGFTTEEYRQLIDFERLLEKYLFAVFDDIKNVVYYYNCEKRMEFYDRFSNPNYFDSILKETIQHIKNFDEENRALFKKEFLRALGLLTKKQSKYISYLFHNVLSNYYLNRNEKYLKDQLNRIKEKTFFLDTNTYYSYKVSASQYHKKAKFIFDKLKSLSCNLRMLNITIQEYNDALNHSRIIYKNDPNAGKRGNDVTWIIYEYLEHIGAYGHNIDSCVDSFLIDQKDNVAFTKREKIRVEKIEEELTSDELGELYTQISVIKKNKRDQKTFEQRVLHDANCLNYLSTKGKGFDADKIFVTCDFNLAKVRKLSEKGNAIITINELYDMLLPYLLVSDNINDNPNRLPNILLETAITLELGDSINLEQIVGDFIKNRPENSRNKIINSSMMKAKFEKIQKKNAVLKESELTDDECIIKIDENYSELVEDYKNAVKKDTIEKLGESKYHEMKDSLSESERIISEKEERIKELEARLEKAEKKNKRREKYEKNKVKKSGLHNKRR